MTVHDARRSIARGREGEGGGGDIDVASPLFERQAGEDLLQQGILQRVDQTPAQRSIGRGCAWLLIGIDLRTLRCPGHLGAICRDAQAPLCSL